MIILIKGKPAGHMAGFVITKWQDQQIKNKILHVCIPGDNFMPDEETINRYAETLNSLSCIKSAQQLSFLANLLAVAISKGKNADQLNVLGNFIVGVGGLILTIAAQLQACETKQDKITQINDPNKQVKYLEGLDAPTKTS